MSEDLMNDYGHRLMPSILNHEAKQNPDRTFAIVTLADNESHIVTFRHMAAAVSLVTHWLRSEFPNVAQHETIAYIGVPDIRYNIFFYAAVQCRLKVFLPSPRNPQAVNSALLDQTQCHKVVYTVEVAPVARELQSASKLHIAQIQSVEEILAGTAPATTYDYLYQDIYKEPILILHSSGSTGLPKPITMSHGTLATYDVRDWPSVEGRTNHDGLSTLRFEHPESRVYDVFPPFHVAGFMIKVMAPLYNLTAPVFGPATRPPSGTLVAEMIRKHRPHAACLPPTITEQLYRDPSSSTLLNGLDVLLYAGGPLHESVGSELSKHTTLCQFYGSTDMGQIRQLLPRPEDWAYFEFHPHERFEMQPHGMNDMSELVVYSGEDLERTSSLYHNFPEIREWRTKDLFLPHPTKPNLWKFATRTDDILVFSSGEKLNPIPIESCLSTVPGIRGVLVVGEKQPQSVLLLELDPEHSFSGEPIDELWSAIDTANALIPGHGRVSRSMIILADAPRPFVRTGKGTIVRRLTAELYNQEITAKFADKEISDKGVKPQQTSQQPLLKPSVFVLADVKSFVRSILGELSLGTIGDDDNFYTFGLDSIRTAEAVSLFKSHIVAYKSTAETRTISGELFYRHPTVNEVSERLLSFLNNTAPPKRKDRISQMQDQIAACVSHLPKVNGVTSHGNRHAAIIAITGTTGFFGAYLARAVLDNASVSKIYCLNRSPTARQSFESRFGTIGADRLEFLHVNLSAPSLGLDASQYAKLQLECDAVAHNAWRVDFNLALPSFKDNLESVERLVELCATSHKGARLVFVSSVSATGVWAPYGSPKQTVPAAIVDDLGSALETGYGESKLVAEKVLEKASRNGIPVSVIRMPQLSPAMELGKEVWPADDIIPVFLQTCKSLGLVAQDFLDRVDWVPVDEGATVVRDLVLHDVERCADRMQVYNVVHRRPQPWSAVLGPIVTWCGSARQVSLRDWVKTLREHDQTDPATVQRLPALRMLPMFELIANRGPFHDYETANLVAASPHMEAIPIIDGARMEGWLQRWNGLPK